MSKETFQLYKKDKEKGLEDITFKPAGFGMLLIFSLLGGTGIGLLSDINDIGSVLLGGLFIVIGMYGMAKQIAIAKENK